MMEAVASQCASPTKLALKAKRLHTAAGRGKIRVGRSRPSGRSLPAFVLFCRRMPGFYSVVAQSSELSNIVANDPPTACALGFENY